MNLDDALARARTTLSAVWDVFHGEVTSVGPRTQPLLAYVGLGLEHVDSIIVLMRHGNFGSALALQRPVIEILLRATWTATCATDEDVARMRKDDFRFPDAARLVKEIDKALGSGDFFRGLHKQHWTALNSYTHSGMLQLASRFRNADLEPYYNENEKRSALDGSLIAMVLLLTLVLRMHNRYADALRVDQMLQTFAGSALPE